MADQSAETLSIADILEIQRSGAEVKINRPPIPPMQIAGFEALLQTMESLVQAMNRNNEAEVARSKVQNEVLQTLQSLIRKPVAVEALRKAFADMQAANQPLPKPVYEFDIKRSRQGFLERIVATPKEPSKYQG